MNIYFLILLRVVHISAGVLWVGSAVFYLFFVETTVKFIGPAGQKFMGHLVGRGRYPLYMSIVSLLTILAGALLYLYTSGGLQINWIKTGPGIGFTIGSVVSIAVYFIGMFMIKPRAERLAAIGKEIGVAGGAPSAVQAAELEKLDRELTKVERLDFVMLTIALLTMATARYWGF